MHVPAVGGRSSGRIGGRISGTSINIYIYIYMVVEEKSPEHDKKGSPRLKVLGTLVCHRPVDTLG